MFRTGIALALLLSVINGWAQDQEQEQQGGWDWRILVLPLWEKNALDPGHEAYQSANKGFATFIGDNVFEPAMDPNLPDCLRYICKNKTKAQVIEHVRKSDKLNIDLILFYSLSSIKANNAASAYIAKYSLSVNSEMLDVETGRKLPGWDLKLDNSDPIHPDCKDTCLEKKISDLFRLIANDTGNTLYDILSMYQRRFTYQVKLHDFALDEIKAVKAGLREVDPEGLVRQSNFGASKRQLLHQIASGSFYYDTRLSPQRFKRELDLLAIDGSSYGVSLHSQLDFSYSYKRTTMAYMARYGVAVLLILVLAYVFYAVSLRKKHQKIIQEYQNLSLAQQGYDHIENTSLTLVPKPSEWPAQKKAFLNDIQQAERLVKQALETGSQGNFQDAFGLLDQAEQKNNNNADIAVARQTLDNYKHGEALFRHASEQVHTDPTAALNYFKEVVTLNPLLVDQVKQLEATAQSLIRKGLITETLQTLQFADMDNPYVALVTVNQALAKLENVEGMHVDRSELLKAQGDFLAKIKPIKGTVLGRGGLNGFSFFYDNILNIGRKSDSRVGELAIGYKRLSRMGKQNRIEREMNSFSVVDLGSANGSWLDANLITDNKPLRLTSPLHTLNMGGRKSPPEHGLCQFSLQMPKVGEGTLLIKIDPDAYSLADKNQLAESWPTNSYDAASHWVMLISLGIGVTDSGELDVGCFNSEPMLKLTIRDQQYWLEPVQHQGEYKVFINSTKVDADVPLISGAIVQIAQHSFSLEMIEEQKDITQCQ